MDEKQPYTLRILYKNGARENYLIKATSEGVVEIQEGIARGYQEGTNAFFHFTDTEQESHIIRVTETIRISIKEGWE